MPRYAVVKVVPVFVLQSDENGSVGECDYGWAGYGLARLRGRSESLGAANTPTRAVSVSSRGQAVALAQFASSTSTVHSLPLAPL